MTSKKLCFHTTSTDPIDLLVFPMYRPDNTSASVAWAVIKFSNQNSEESVMYSSSFDVAVCKVGNDNQVVSLNGISIGEGQTAEIVPEGDSVIIKGPTGDVKKGSPTSVKNSTTKYQTVAVLIGEEKNKKPALLFEKVNAGDLVKFIFLPTIYLLARSIIKEGQVVKENQLSMIELENASIAASDEVHILLDVDNQQGGLTTVKFGPNAESMKTEATIREKVAIF